MPGARGNSTFADRWEKAGHIASYKVRVSPDSPARDWLHTRVYPGRLNIRAWEEGTRVSHTSDDLDDICNRAFDAHIRLTFVDMLEDLLGHSLI